MDKITEDEEAPRLCSKTYDELQRENFVLWGGFCFVLFIALLLAFGLSSCTINQNMTHSIGNKSGNLRDTTETTADPETDLSMPLEGR